MPQTLNPYRAGQRVRVIQQIPQRDEVWTTRLEGTVVRFEQQKTGAWFAHSKDDRLWLDRLVLQKDDGEQVACILDRYSHVKVLAEPTPDSLATAPPAEAAVKKPDEDATSSTTDKTPKDGDGRPAANDALAADDALVDVGNKASP